MRFPPFLPAAASLSAAFFALVGGVSCREEAVGSEPPAISVGPKLEGTTYVMEMKGMVCGGCMMEVKDALAKVDGVADEAVVFKRGSRPETKKVVFTAKSATLTRDQIVEALGEAAERLVIENFGFEEKS